MEDLSMTAVENSRIMLTLEVKDKKINHNLDQFIKAYEYSLNAFSHYVESLDGENKRDLIKENAITIEYHVNEIELRFLLILQFIATYCPELINEKQGYSFIACESFFIKSCKDIFSIQSDDEFTNSFTDSILPIMKNILGKIDSSNTKKIFSRTLSSIQLTLFHSQTSKSITDLIQKISHKREALQLYISINSDIHKIKGLISSFMGSNHAFNNTVQNLLDSIEYRLQKKEYFATLINNRVNSALSKIHLLSDEVADMMKNALQFAHDEFSKALEEDTNLSAEEREYFEMEKYTFQAEIWARTHGDFIHHDEHSFYPEHSSSSQSGNNNNF